MPTMGKNQIQIVVTKLGREMIKELAHAEGKSVPEYIEDLIAPIYMRRFPITRPNVSHQLPPQEGG